MSDHPQRELAPLAALGALDGESLLEWNAHLAECEACRQELAEYESVTGMIGMAAGEVRPSADLRRRVLAVTGPAAAPVPVRPEAPASSWLAYAASFLAVALAGSILFFWFQREAAQREASRLREQVAALESQTRMAQSQAAGLQQRLAEQAAFLELLADRETRTAALAGLPDAPAAHGTMVWNTPRRQGVLVASGLPVAPPGKAYELWVIAGGAPVPAGVFQVDAQGRAVFRMPWVDDATRAKTFAVTLEPAQGVPAPTGLMVLAGAVS